MKFLTKLKVDRKDIIDNLCENIDSLEQIAFEQKSEIERLKKIVEGYAASARIISLYLQEFCDKHLPYDEMIAEASKKAANTIEGLREEVNIKTEMLNDMQCRLLLRKMTGDDNG